MARYGCNRHAWCDVTWSVGDWCPVCRLVGELADVKARLDHVERGKTTYRERAERFKAERDVFKHKHAVAAAKLAAVASRLGRAKEWAKMPDFDVPKPNVLSVLGWIRSGDGEFPGRSSPPDCDLPEPSGT